MLNEETSISVVFIQYEEVILALMEQPLSSLHLQKIMGAVVHGVETIVMLTGCTDDMTNSGLDFMD